MNQTVVSLKLIVYAISLCVSSMPLALAFASMNYHRKSWTKWYIVFQSVLLGVLFLGFLNLISGSLFKENTSRVFSYIFYVMQICTMSFVCMLLPFFLYFVLAKPWRAKQRVVFYSGAVVYLGIGLSGRIAGFSNISGFVITLLFLALYIYCLVVLMANLKTVKDRSSRASCLSLAITSLCLIPATIVAFVFPEVKDFAHPVYVMAFSIIMICFYSILFRQDRKMLENKPKMTLESLSFYKISEREFSVIELICKGETNKEIANKLCISVNTVNNHVANIFEKMNVNSRIDLLNILKEGPLS